MEYLHNVIFHDLYVEKHKGHFSQIDLVVVTEVGIIVFEVKDYSGWIFGKWESIAMDSSISLWSTKISFL